jgi:SAM-dependent methyltransferase
MKYELIPRDARSDLVGNWVPLSSRNLTCSLLSRISTHGAAQLPFEDGAFDVVLSQFGHMFAPRPELAVSEMLRVLKVGGTIAFSTWPPDLLMGRIFSLRARYMPPPPPGVAPPVQWGDQGVIRERLGNGVRDLVFDKGTMPHRP